ncbi:hypothetical protein L1987_78899 [Smallanthus sonchifolius]|uniref:Uncharacterized protein n=1 Tax=Smallanthus sonchifolius TaxID=185202 RepID=A0ACB8ZF02_9ASTR|nr:hypothetical protein L1987_78899 [Smallanthus sonchifolius]
MVTCLNWDFFSPGKSKNRYLGIWYKKISYGTVVWVANRDTPIKDKSGILKLSIHGNLEIRSGGNNMVWSSNSTVPVGSNSPVVQLLDTGNLVVKNKNRAHQDMIWESFDYPGDTILPGIKFGKDLVTGIQRFMTSWKSPNDPPIGVYSNIVNTNGYPQTFGWRGQVLVSRLGPWNGLGFSGFPTEKENGIYSTEFVINEKEIYHKFVLKSSVVQRVVLTWDGKTQILQWIERIKDCINKHPPCTCMEGFEPRDPEEWEASDWASGCIRKKPLDCRNTNGDGFWKVAGVKVPDTRRSWYNVSMTIRECEMVCKKNCSCTVRKGHLDPNKKKRILTMVLLTSSALPIILCRNIKKRAQVKKRGNRYMLDEKNTSMQMEQFVDSQFFSLFEVAKATNNFSASCKIGEGGFGPVYKGVLEDGREIAVKRLSETSHQGLSHLYCKTSASESYETRSLMLDWPQRFNIIQGMAREYAVYGRFSIKSDVFSFGVLVLISGKKNREFCHENHSDNLLGHGVIP